MSVQRTLIFLTALTVALPVGATVLRANQVASQVAIEQQALARQQTATARRGDVRASVSALGSLQPEAAVDVSFLVGGEVVEVLVETGDYVYAGQPLARLKSTNQQIAYDQAQLTLERATINLEDLLGPVDENDVRVAEANINSARGNYSSVADRVSAEDLQAAELRYQQSQDAYAEAERARRVSGNLDEREVAQLDAQLGELSFNSEIARLNLESLRTSNQGDLGEASARIVQAQRQLDQVLAGPSQSQLDNAALAVQRAESALRDAEIALNRTTLVSPVDGVVTTVDLKAGETVAARTPLVEVTDTSAFRLMASVDETDVPGLTVGMSAYVRLDALPGIDFPATITRIDVLGTETNNVVSYTAEVRLTAPDSRLRMGMTGEAFLVTDERDDVLLVPNNFLLTSPEDGSTYVNVRHADGVLEAVQVMVGLRGEDDTEILIGLREGDVVVTES